MPEGGGGGGGSEIEPAGLGGAGGGSGLCCNIASWLSSGCCSTVTSWIAVPRSCAPPTLPTAFSLPISVPGGFIVPDGESAPVPGGGG